MSKMFMLALDRNYIFFKKDRTLLENIGRSNVKEVVDIFEEARIERENKKLRYLDIVI